MPATPASLADQLRDERRRLGLTQAQLGATAGVSTESIRKYESGARTPTRDHLTQILRALTVPQGRARSILSAAGYTSADSLFPADAYPGYFYTPAEAAEAVALRPWPEFVVSDVQELVAANRAACLLWDVDLGAELARRGRPQLHFLALMAEPRFAARLVNFDECLAMAVSVVKGAPAGGAGLDMSGPWAEQVLGQFAATNPSALSSLLTLWDRTPPRAAKSRWSYRVVWREPEGEMRFTGLVTSASEPHGLAFNDWLPEDAASHAVLEAVIANRGGGSPRAGASGQPRGRGPARR